MQTEKDQIKESLDRFYLLIDTYVTPYFKENGFSVIKRKARGMIIFEKSVCERNVSVDYFSYAKYEINGFRVMAHSKKEYLHIVKNHSMENEIWQYKDEEEQIKMLIESLEILKTEGFFDDLA